MKKLTFDFLSIELTRRCNIACKHCMRGDAQNIDIKNSTLDSLLNQTQIIGKLQFGGGEPTLCIDKMEYILEKMKKNGVLLFALEIVTNGYLKSDKFVKVVREYGEYIKYCWMNEKLNLDYYVSVLVSVDKYHENEGYDPEDSYWFYKVNLCTYAKVDRQETGKFPKKKGRAKLLIEAWDADYDNFSSFDRRVEILSKDNKPCCPNYKMYKLVYDEQVYVVCDLVVTAKGDITFIWFNNGEWELEDRHVICNANEDIYEKILEFNKGKNTCVKCLREEKNKEFMECIDIWERNKVGILNGTLKISDIIEFNANQYVNKNNFDPDLYSKEYTNVRHGNIGNLDEVEDKYINHDYKI